MVINDTYDFIKAKFNSHLENIRIEKAVFGAHLSAVKLTDGSYGVAGTLSDNQYHCRKQDRDFGDFTPTKITGQSVASLFETDKSSGLIDTLRIAVLNAISSAIIAKGNYKIIENTDPFDLLDLSQKKTITIVGAFQSYIQRISESNHQLIVLELNKDALSSEYQKYYVPAGDYTKVVPGSDVVIITGLTLVNGTIDGLLSAVSPDTKVIVTGPSGSIVPDILFRNKVNIIGATRISNPDLLFPVVCESGTGFHLFRYCAQKICIVNEQQERA